MIGVLAVGSRYGESPLRDLVIGLVLFAWLIALAKPGFEALGRLQARFDRLISGALPEGVAGDQDDTSDVLVARPCDRGPIVAIPLNGVTFVGRRPYDWSLEPDGPDPVWSQLIDDRVSFVRMSASLAERSAVER